MALFLLLDRLSVLVVVIIFAILFVSPSFSSTDIRILKAERRIDLTSSIVRAFHTLQVENIGDSHASEILLAFPPDQAKHMADLQASTSQGKKKKKNYIHLDVNPIDSSQTPNGAKLFSVSLNHNPLKTGETKTLELLVILTHVLEPFPAEISQSESQLVHYRDSAILLSPYPVKEQMTYIKTPSKKVESYSMVNPTNRVGEELRYGSYADSAPYSYTPILVHFENNHPFAVIEELVRVIEISHWGNIQVKEQYRLLHGGARHKGVFSRLDYQSRQSSSGVSSFKTLLAKLPPRVHSVYYRDDIGNISSSHLRLDSKKSELQIEPRYPLLGGWKTSFVIGYSLPLESSLFEMSDGRHCLKFNFGSPFLETVVDKLTIKVVLPEGSKEPTASVSFPVEQHHETSFSYLDIVGRPTVVLKKENVVPENNTPFQVYYSFSPFFMFVEPLMLVSVFLLFFISVIAYLHTDLSIRKAEHS